MRFRLCALTILLICWIPLTGCVRLTYNPDTKQASYTRIGDTDIAGFSITTTPDGVTSVTLEKASSQATALEALAGTVQTLTERATP